MAFCLPVAFSPSLWGWLYALSTKATDRFSRSPRPWQFAHAFRRGVSRVRLTDHSLDRLSRYLTQQPSCCGYRRNHRRISESL